MNRQERGIRLPWWVTGITAVATLAVGGLLGYASHGEDNSPQPQRTIISVVPNVDFTVQVNTDHCEFARSETPQEQVVSVQRKESDQKRVTIVIPRFVTGRPMRIC